MKRLPTSINDNWYSDLYPTWSQYVAYQYNCWSYRWFGYIGSLFLSVPACLFGVARILELFFYRRQQLKYWD